MPCVLLETFGFGLAGLSWDGAPQGWFYYVMGYCPLWLFAGSAHPNTGWQPPFAPPSSRAQVGLRRVHGRPWRGPNRVRSLLPHHRREVRSKHV